MLRRVCLAAGLTALALYVWIAVAVYRSQADPEHFEAWDGPNAWIVGPTARALNRVAGERIDAGIAALNDTSRPPPERLGIYRDNLRAAERLLIRSLRAQPAQARTLARLAAVRWELDPPLDEAGMRRFLETIAAASHMAPRSAEVQKDLGDLLTRMGRLDEALPYLAQAIVLDPGLTSGAVGILLHNLVPPEEIRQRLPRRPEVIVALSDAYLAAEQGDDLLTACEEVLEPPNADVLIVYTGAALATRQAARALDRIDRIGVQSETVVEAERLLQRSRLAVAVDETARAVADARAARDLQPEVPRFAENLGRAALAAGDPESAVQAFRDALALAARLPDDPTKWRAMIYGEIGRAEEVRNATDRAYDAYRKALELDPDQRFARSRLDVMHDAAGLPSRSPSE